MEHLVSVITGWLYAALVVVCLLVALLKKREPAAALGWSLAIVFVPVVGPLLFLLLGLDRIPKRLQRRKAHQDRFAVNYTQTTRLSKRDVLHRAAHEGRWGELSRVLEKVGGGPRRSGNAIRFYSEERSPVADVTRRIEVARHHIHLEVFILRNDELGNGLVARLEEKCRQGVKVRLIVDGFGTPGAGRLLKRVSKAGGEARAFNPMILNRLASPNLRNHRKIIICDGEVAAFGGMNIGEEYLGIHGARKRPWFDLHAGVRGPAVWDLQRIFLEDWHYCTRDYVENSDCFPALDPEGETTVQMLAGGPDTEVNPIRIAFLGAFARAGKSILLATPYLVPDRSLCDALALAALAGVEVRVVTQAPPPDKWLAWYCGMHYAEELIAAGVRVFGYTPGMMHAKAIVVDGEWAMVGSANFDNRSMHLNFEQMAVLEGGGAVSELEAALESLAAECAEVTRETLESRSRFQKLMSTGSRLLAPLL